MNRIRKCICGFMAAVLCFMFLEWDVKAETAQISIKASATTCEIGTTITVELNISASATIMAYDMVLTYNKDVLEFVSASNDGSGGGGNLMWMARTEGKQTVTFKTTAVGKADIKASFTKIGVGSDTNPQRTDGSCSITVNPKYVASSNNNLASLTVGGATLSPAFNAATTTYSCNVGANVSTLVVTAKQADSKAKVAVAGNTNLKYGRNEIVVTVTAENGAVKKYVIVCNRATPPAEQTTAAPSQPETVIENPKVIVDDVIYHIIVNPAAELPAGFTSQNFDYKGTSVKGGYNEKNNMYLMYLEAEGENKAGAFYVFDAEKDTFTKFISVDNAVNTYVIMPFDSADEQITGYGRYKMIVAGQEVEVYALRENDVYGIFYAMDSEGNMGWYRYCSADGTVQRYVVTEGEFESQDSSDAIKPTGSQGGLDKDMWKAIAIVSMAVALTFLIAVIVITVKNKKNQVMTEPEDEFLAVPKSWQEEEEIEFEVDDELTVEEGDSKEVLEKQDDFDFLEIEEAEIDDNNKNS